ncbi:serine peptidase like protein [Zymoseptoria brevis]|uniref:Serine peptidase like protein n=1 Tax=Zymoseptoria brevis TaxID=1047168 RepID=A0A0F4G781_9PEZI|nr:serine peptidase like protein [Zymoseptoria brevis]
MWTSSTFLLAFCATKAFAFGRALGRRASVPGPEVESPWVVHNGSFAQLIDHGNPGLGTFQQTYWYNYHWYKGEGSPIVLFSPTEANGSRFTGFVSNDSTMGRITQELGGAAIVLEHRYWGDSTPFNVLTVENLKYLTVENAMQDVVYFADNVELPFAPNGTTAKDAPWVLFGGSYAGAITGWVANVHPGTFWAYYSSSALMQAIDPYWQYFSRIQAGMPKNCSKDVSAVVDYMDDVFLHGSEQNATDLKAKFGLQYLHNDDVMAAIGMAPGMWQLGDIRDNHLFVTWCDYIENVNVTHTHMRPEDDGVGVEAALEGYARWWKEVGYSFFRVFNGCLAGDTDLDCFGSHDANARTYTDLSLGGGRQYKWLRCSTPLGGWQTGAPAGMRSLVSRLLTAEYFHQICGQCFPPGPDGKSSFNPTDRTADDFNAFTGGWNPQNINRVLFVNGEFDPWTSSGVSSDFRPGGHMQSSENVTVLVTPGAHHVTDVYTANGVGPGNEKVKATIDAAVAQIVKWVGEWPGRKQEE